MFMRVQHVNICVYVCMCRMHLYAYISVYMYSCVYVCLYVCMLYVIYQYNHTAHVSHRSISSWAMARQSSHFSKAVGLVGLMIGMVP